jgi:hypothetical protein
VCPFLASMSFMRAASCLGSSRSKLPVQHVVGLSLVSILKEKRRHQRNRDCRDKVHSLLSCTPALYTCTTLFRRYPRRDSERAFVHQCIIYALGHGANAAVITMGLRVNDETTMEWCQRWCVSAEGSRYCCFWSIAHQLPRSWNNLSESPLGSPFAAPHQSLHSSRRAIQASAMIV